MVPLDDILKQYWGFNAYLPLQREAMECVLQGRDSLVVLPTGGGKSLCYQAPALTMPGMAVVISPLLSLMKDQVDALETNGVPAARIDSAITAAERIATHEALQARRIKLLYVSPERMAKPAFVAYLQKIGVAYFVVDEAHCISHWGHDFRPEYRELSALRDNFPDASIHAYTATATVQVRHDISTQLHLRKPEALIGSFDRPNLRYRATERHGLSGQLLAYLAERKEEAGIVYCLRRADVDRLCQLLTEKGYQALPYHAGMDAHSRKRNQEAFSKDQTNIIVATIAFGMGIDKSNVRYVFHAAMPKSIEHYQQETGRAGRDGLPADCCMLYSYQDYRVWESILDKLEDTETKERAHQKLRDMLNYCKHLVCRHKTLSEYFGQSYSRSNCDACDICSGEVEVMEEAGEIAVPIVKAVQALGTIAGPNYTTLVLTGSKDQRILGRGHDKCAGYGALAAYDTKTVRDWVEQMEQQGFLEKQGEYNILHLTATGRETLHGDAVPRLLRPAVKPARRASIRKQPREQGYVDPELFEALRQMRLEKSKELEVAPFIIFSDASLRDMTRRKPDTHAAFLEVQGVGAHKCEAFGDDFMNVIRAYRAEHPETKDAHSE